MKHDLLEFSVLKEYIKPLVSSDMGLSALAALNPAVSWEEARSRLALLKEMMDLMNAGSAPVPAAIADIRPLLSIREGSVLEGQDLVRVSGALADMARLKKALGSAGGLLAEAVSYMETLDHVSGHIDAMLLPTGEISDDAYPYLRDLRSRYRAVRTSVLERLEGIIEKLKARSVLMEELITKRNDRYVIPVRHDYHLHMKGIIHDYSRSNRTAYVEPLAVVDGNNTLNQIKSQIIEEEQKVLRELTSLVIESAASIRENLLVYGRLDLVCASARWAIAAGGSIPRIEGDEIRLGSARHPILIERLGKSATVALDILIPKGKDCLIITGPNAGGKTVALKTLGLLIQMAKSGLAIPAALDSVIAPVGEVHVEMDTNQDITHDLSSFTAHALSLKGIYEKVAEGDLVLLDEPGSGTDHDQGGALAVSCIDALRRKGATVVVTSHSDLVKLYGTTSEGVQNAATAFDDTGLKPLYALQYGMVGQSRAFEILEAISFPHELICDARDIAGRTGNSPLARAIQDISKASSLRAQAEKDLEEAKRMKELSEQELRTGRKERMESALRYKRLIEQLEMFSRKQVTQEAVLKVKQTAEAQELSRVLAEIIPAKTLEIRKGCTVRLRGTEQEGEVMEVGHETAEVAFGTKRLQVGLENIEVVSQPDEGRARVKTVSRIHAPVPVLPIKVVGMRVDEAIPLVEKAIDRAMLTGQESLEIIHGAGTGRLRKAIREYLKEMSCVKTIQDAPMAEGGGNKTIVLLGVK